jgi:undecaprenyl-diphosphatase
MHLPAPISRFVSALRDRRDLLLLLALVVLVAGGWGLALIIDWVGDGDARKADEYMLLFFRTVDDLTDPIGGSAIEEAMRDLTALGGAFVTTLVSVAAVSFFLLDGRPRAAGLLALIIAAGIGVVFLIKFGIDRPRPDLVPHAMHALSPSFPSGHAATSAVVYLTVGSLLARALPSLRLRVFTLGIAIFLTLGIGISRVYLGVHWPTDVLAGWTIGSVWALGGWLVERHAQRAGWVERSRAIAYQEEPDRRVGETA